MPADAQHRPEDLDQLDRLVASLEVALDLKRRLRRYWIGPDGEPTLDLRALGERLSRLPDRLDRDD